MYTKLSLFVLILSVIVIYYFTLTPQQPKNLPNLFTPDDLKRFNGIDSPNLYLSILGKVFDVSKAPTYYGPGATYRFFTGKDASRSFVTGQFDDNYVSDEVADLSLDDLRSLNHWVKFYHKEYKRIGKLVGRYYNENGELTQYGKNVKRLIEQAEGEKESQNLEKIKYPPCNVEWNADTGSRVWCTDKSGGIKRNWVGYPRQLYEPGVQDHRCACIKSPEISGNLKLYDGCDIYSESCFVK